MKKLLISLTLLFSIQLVMAKKLVVTSASDIVDSPTSGMLRYFVNNAESGDTITFSVAKVTLAGQISVSSTVVIDGGSNKVTVDGNFLDRVFNVTTYSSINQIVIKNLKIINGKRTGDLAWGGGMYVFVSGGTVTVDNCVFYNNEAATNAGGDGQGGALRNQGGTFTNCSFINNKVTGTTGPQGGGGVQAVDGTFINCVFSGNKAKYGAGIYASDAYIYNCTAANNKSTGSGAAAGIQSEGTGVIVNCVAYNNLLNTTVSNISALEQTKVTNCALESGNALVGTNGNIGLTASPFKGGKTADSLSLIQGSSCIDAGTSTNITVLANDIAGNKRTAGNAIDIGAYEYGSTVGIFDQTSDTELVVYPNPSKGIFYLTADVLKSGKVSVEVYDLIGNLVSVQDDITSGGYFQIAKSGVFLAKINVDNTVYRQKLIVE